ncbi:MAG: hypothetical protein KAH21_10295 [Spirochaetaceae bacterium]|nr:hypothetical protein [Spirochaetaceae bacterium]
MKYSLLLFLLLFSLFSASAKEWPDDSVLVLDTFGTAASGYFNHGLSFKSEGQRIKAWSGGEVVWISGSGDLSSSVLENGLIVIEHSDGFRSSYNSIEIRPDLDVRVSSGEWLGYAGESTWLFEITDIERSRKVDPVTLLPSRKNLPPVSIGVVELVRGSERLELKNETVLTPGRWTVVVNDFFSSGASAIPMEVSLFWVGESIGSFRFNALAEGDEGIVLETPEPRRFNLVYNSNGELWFPEVLLNAGKGTLELRIRDELERVVSRSWMLSIR